MARAKECEITAKDGAKWDVKRKSPEPRGPSPYRVSQDPPGVHKSKKEQDVGADIFEDLEEEPAVFDIEALEQALESAQLEDTPCWRETTSGIPDLDPKSVNSWIIGKLDLSSVVSWIAEFLHYFNVEILDYENEHFKWKCRIWDTNYESSSSFTLKLFKDGPKSEKLRTLVCLASVYDIETLGRRGPTIDLGFRLDFANWVATGAELINQNDSKLVRELHIIGSLKDSRSDSFKTRLVLGSDPLYSEYELEEDIYLYDNLELNPRWWAPREKVMEIFNEDFLAKRKASSCINIPIEVVVIDALSRLFKEKEVFSIEDILVSVKKVLSTDDLKWNWYHVCSKTEDLNRLLSDRKVISTSDVALLGEILCKLEEITATDESSELLWTLANKAKEDLRTFVPQLVKSHSSTTPSGGGGGGGKKGVSPH